MRQIYQSCSRVVIWLGEEDKYTDSGLMLARRLVSLAREHLEDGHLTMQLSLPISIKNVFGAEIPNVYHPAWWNFSRLFERPWFDRIWVVQELAVCPSTLVVIGGHSIDWEDFSLANRVVRSRFGAPFMLFQQRQRTQSGVEEDLIMLVVRHAERVATDRRDMIYALSGLVRETNKIGPNYHIDLAEAHFNFTIHCLRKMCTLDVIRTPRAQTDDPTCPPWAYPCSPEPLLKYERSIAWQWPLDPDFSIGFAAAGSSKYIYSDQICLHHERGKRWPFLRLHGFIFDTVKETAMPSIGTTMDRCHSLPTIFWHALKQMICHCHWLRFTGAADHSAEYLPTGERARDAFWQICGAGVLPDLRDKTKAVFERFDTATRFFQRFSSCRRRRGLAAHLVMAVGFAQIVAEFPVGRMSASDIEWVYEISWRRNRRIVRTANGYLGMAPMRAEAGDKVGLFQGCRVLLVVRRVETAYENSEKWRVICDAYIHGIMMGEKWDEGSCRDFWFE